MSKNIEVSISGASGRMGQELIKLIENEKSISAVAPYERKSKRLPSCDVVIDFSLPQGFSALLKACVEKRVPLVSGVTGLSENQMREIASAAKKIPILWSSNMSIGVAVLNSVLKNLAPLSDYEFQIEETHHIHKKDRPSGTAITLQKNLEKAVGKKLPEPISIRGGGVFGIHEVHSLGPEETLTLKHCALNRTVFARGALRAARWLASKKPGLYSLQDVLGLD
jgi:4-hydroxy-tetrahydrodipicolinate reductase